MIILPIKGCHYNNGYNDTPNACRHNIYKKWKEYCRDSFIGNQYKCEYFELQKTTFIFFADDKVLLKSKLFEIESKIKEIKKRNHISEFKLLIPLRRTARWILGVLLLMKCNAPSVAANKSRYNKHPLNFKGTKIVYKEIRDFLKRKPYSNVSCRYEFSLMQIAGT